MEKYDVCVIGGGPAGYAAAMRAVDFKKKVLLIEKNKIGGAGIQNGALSSKTWWELSREAYALRVHCKSTNVPSPDHNFQILKSEVDKAVGKRRDLLEHHMHNINLNSQGEYFHYVQGIGKVVGNTVVSIKKLEGEDIEIEADNIILATGSRPRKLDNIPIDEETILTSDGIENLKSFPKSIVIVGAGVIGCEFATIFSNFGQTKVHMIDKGNRILPFEDSDIVDIIESNLESKEVLIHRNSQLVDMKIENGMVVYTLEYNNGSREIFHVEKALVSVGRVPNYENLISGSVKINKDNKGIIDDLTQTSIPNIFAVGDITADIALVNVGELEGRYAIEKIFGEPERPLIYENISTIMFLAPEVAGVGLNEVKARELGISYKVVCLDYSCISRAIAMRNTDGFMKIIVSNDEEMRVLGMRVVGEHASSSIEAVALLISMGKGIGELAELIHPHPSIIEGIQECVRMLLNKSMLKPGVLRQAMRCASYHNGELKNVEFI
ncbi:MULTISPECIES: dihydrolipoyl dehydrogenase family protein [Reichenbachiella]|uniref:Dihydrolipoamide dehydrogenase n=1 Tax=Reichenbachiella agariperforans TaxID=156994 RepID=A0A1M6L274_REIAG|nr:MULTISPECIES: NAD(P)/FAD-dependent oxidoreductase [Reichenbachiella]MBU2913758.1 NAD(P)/FAD-dependent oxidoreductase [Reichenbachiella agariperforans]RJE74310.1 pyridine nucleotide-disulfide oxidoreductase [Reichenbachiella sp. MSK19-1]SHJ65202.1 dihydrolipoamide dehydrogenase [Reichenbachiella agariperforans]